MLGRLGDDGLLLQEVHRFTYPPAERNGHLRWDVEHIWSAVKDGLRAAQAAAKGHGAEIASVGVDSWGVDYGLVDAAGALVEEPACYRDPRRTALMAEVLERLPREEMFARTGIQFLPFNTVYQLYAHVKEGIPSGAVRLLMIPDLLHARLADTHAGRIHERHHHPAPRPQDRPLGRTPLPFSRPAPRADAGPGTAGRLAGNPPALSPGRARLARPLHHRPRDPRHRQRRGRNPASRRAGPTSLRARGRSWASNALSL